MAIERLRADARMWRGTAATAGTARAAGAGLDLGESQLSWASRPTGLLDTYREAQRKTLRLLDEAERSLDDLGAALDRAADGYERDERDAVHRMSNLYRPSEQRTVRR
ncbi:hypothetical protein HC031_02280 [Planosporangium thailandense]|uniref:Excreted virulence factor EspC (Type VII ESX diderm) n=1 Tax=Planosporangium thailandense TaxID=765197 RepID=A0ABX0XRD2_9ACTN|nr:hypothetical protein [Planosporangium thailandense]NJC68556.1 hypothetical protein [Planosporangium thailandense]